MISYTVRDYVWLVLKYLIVGLVIGGLGVILYASFFKDPETSRLQKELKYMDAQISGMRQQMDLSLIHI